MLIKELRGKIHSDIIRKLDRIDSFEKTIFSYCNNRMLQKQNICWDSYYEYQYYKSIHTSLHIFEIDDTNINLVRLGRDEDGGYIMAKPFSSKKIAYSIGIADDVTWDRELAKYGYEIYQYDHTINRLPETNRHFHFQRIGISGKNENNKNKLSKMLIDNGHKNTYGMILKMDVEGCEWDVLDTLEDDTLIHFDQIIIELHDLHNITKSKKIINGILKLTLNHSVVHIHGNNWGPVSYCNNLITPNILEVTLFINDKISLKDGVTNLPREIDIPCVSDRPEIFLGIWNV